MSSRINQPEEICSLGVSYKAMHEAACKDNDEMCRQLNDVLDKHGIAHETTYANAFDGALQTLRLIRHVIDSWHKDKETPPSFFLKDIDRLVQRKDDLGAASEKGVGRE